MKNIYIQPSMNLTGSEQSLYQTLSFVNNPHECTVLTFENGPMKVKLEGLGVKVNIIKGSKLQRNFLGFSYFVLSFFSIFLFGLTNCRKLKQCNVIYLNTLMSPQFFVLKLFSGINTRFITHVREFHTTYPERVYTSYFSLSNFFSNSFIFCTGAIAKQECLKRIKLKPYEVIHNTSSFPVSEARGNTLSRNKFRIGFVGATTLPKGIDRVLSFMEEYGKSTLNIELAIAGKVTDNPILLQNQPSLGIEFLGSISDMANFYQNIDCLVMVSRTETFPRVIIEAFNHGIPVLATDVGGVYEALSEGGGIIMRNDDETIASELYDGILEISSDYSSYSQSAILAYRNKFSPREINRRLSDVIG